MAKESWLQRLHVKPLIARIQIEFLCGIKEFIYCNTLHFFLAKNRQQQQKEEFKRAEEEIKALHGIEPSLLDTQPENRELAQYLDVLKGATKYDTIT
ncbi:MULTISPECIES: hypothetical protein [Heyndrickxia]|nr:hypothetical protein [Heyndrickxia coagulans]